MLDNMWTSGIVVLMWQGDVSNGLMFNEINLVLTVFYLIGSRNFEHKSYKKYSGWSSEKHQTARRHILNLHASLCDLQRLSENFRQKSLFHASW
jgi:hypothetical protein